MSAILIFAKGDGLLQRARLPLAACRASIIVGEAPAVIDLLPSVAPSFKCILNQFERSRALALTDPAGLALLMLPDASWLTGGPVLMCAPAVLSSLLHRKGRKTGHCKKTR